VKPFELLELLARVRAQLRRSLTQKTPNLDTHLHREDLELDRENQLAYRGGRTIELSEKESTLLEYFMRHSGQLLTHSEIYQHLWPTEEKPSSNVLAAQIRLLRRKIEAPGEVPLIHTVYGKGYRFGSGSESS
ncbi:MAG TPA: response regulator transcription factor, partial [Vampirovibrionales bacterium]